MNYASDAVTVPDTEVVQVDETLCSGRSGAAWFRARCGRCVLRRLNSGTDDPDASGLEYGVERGGEAGVPVMQDELHSCPGLL